MPSKTRKTVGSRKLTAKPIVPKTSPPKDKDVTKPKPKVVQKKADKHEASSVKDLDQMFKAMANQNFQGLVEIIKAEDPILTSVEDIVSFLNGIVDFGVVVETDKTPRTDEYMKKKETGFKSDSLNALPLQVLKEILGNCQYRAVLLPEVPVEIIVKKQQEGSMMKEMLYDSHVDEKKAAVEKKVVPGALFLMDLPDNYMLRPGTPVSVKIAGETVKIADVKANCVAYGKYESEDGTLCPFVIKVNPFVMPVVKKKEEEKQDEEEDTFGLYGQQKKGKAPPKPEPKKK